MEQTVPQLRRRQLRTRAIQTSRRQCLNTHRRPFRSHHRRPIQRTTCAPSKRCFPRRIVAPSSTCSTVTTETRTSLSIIFCRILSKSRSFFLHVSFKKIEHKSLFMSLDVHALSFRLFSILMLFTKQKTTTKIYERKPALNFTTRPTLTYCTSCHRAIIVLLPASLSLDLFTFADHGVNTSSIQSEKSSRSR